MSYDQQLRENEAKLEGNLNKLDQATNSLDKDKLDKWQGELAARKRALLDASDSGDQGATELAQVDVEEAKAMIERLNGTVPELRTEVACLRRRGADIRAREAEIRAREAEIRARERELRQQLEQVQRQLEATEQVQRQLEATEQTITTELKTLQKARDEAKAEQGEFLCSCRQPHPPSPPPSHTRANTRKHTPCTRPWRSHVLLFPLRPLPLDREQEACARAEGRCDISSLCSNHVARAFMTAQQSATHSLVHPLTPPSLFAFFLRAFGCLTAALHWEQFTTRDTHIHNLRSKVRLL